NQDRSAHIVPRIAGFVHTVNKSVGDFVRSGDVLAVLDSRDLADTKSNYLASLERLDLAAATFSREEGLFQKKISSEQEYLQARHELAEARINLRSARQKLLALGLDEEYIMKLPEQAEHGLVHYELTAPISGVVIDKHISQGESVAADAEAFSIADLRTVWADLNIFQKDLDLVREQQSVTLQTTSRQHSAVGTIAYIRPIVGEETRTAIARVVLNNADGRWKPGMFVNGSISVDAVEVPVVVERSALVTRGDDQVIFVHTDQGIESVVVTIGRTNATHAEVTTGLTAGDRYVSHGSFALKAELEKGELGEGDAD
ncbi:MAG: efflux RND transporter periplasmic adaptor subunit, partial [Rhodothermales bacterium]|nr:efflux RND transporter periplasmic adaptor subunit [Rhodothermales bacterium]